VPIRHGETQPNGPYAVFQVLWGSEHAADDVGILYALPPARGPGGVDARGMWLAALALKGYEVPVIAQHLRWAGEEGGVSPVRHASDGSTLRPFQLEGEPFLAVHGRHGAKIISAAGVFVALGARCLWHALPMGWRGLDDDSPATPCRTSALAPPARSSRTSTPCSART
jgi:hypothetical protein